MPTLAHPFRLLRRAYKLAQETVSQHPAAGFTVRDYFPEAVKVIGEEELRARNPLGQKEGIKALGRFFAEALGPVPDGFQWEAETLGDGYRLTLHGPDGWRRAYAISPRHARDFTFLCDLAKEAHALARGSRGEIVDHALTKAENFGRPVRGMCEDLERLRAAECRTIERAERIDRARHVLCRWLAEVTGKDSHQIAAAAWYAESIDEPLPSFLGGIGTGVGGHVTNPSMEDKTVRRSVPASNIEPLREDELAGIMDGPEMMPNSGEQVGPSAAKGGGWAFGKGAEAPCYEDDDPGQIGPECFRGSDFD